MCRGMGACGSECVDMGVHEYWCVGMAVGVSEYWCVGVGTGVWVWVCGYSYGCGYL